MKVAAILTAHNVAPWVGAAVRSMLAQDRPPQVAVVVENGSTDDTLERIREAVAAYRGPAAVVVESAGRPLGPAGARNLGTQIAAERGAELFGHLDGDDWWAPGFLGHLCALLEARPEAGAAFCGCWLTTAEGRRRSLRFRIRRTYDYRLLCRHKSPMITASSMMVRLEDHRAVSGFTPEVSPGEDWELLLAIARRGRVVAASPRPLVYYRRRPASASAEGRALHRCLRAVEELHPRARRAKHWWWVLNRALRGGDAEAVRRIHADRPPAGWADYLSPHFLIHLYLRARRIGPPPAANADGGGQARPRQP